MSIIVSFNSIENDFSKFLKVPIMSIVGVNRKSLALFRKHCSFMVINTQGGALCKT